MKKITGFLAVVLTASTLAYSTPSKAAVGILTLNPATILGGLAMMGGGVGLLSAPTRDFNHINGAGGVIGFLGIILLDGENGQEIAFGQLSVAAAKKLRVTEVERRSFNAEIDQANFIFDEVGMELKEMHNPTAKDASLIWARYDNLVSDNTFSAMKKVARKSK